MRKLLWIGDAAVPSGFARSTHHTLEVIRQSWDVRVLGLNYRGDPHDYPYKIYPAALGNRQDLFGLLRVPELIQEFRPDVVVLQNDPWNIPQYTEMLRNVPVVAALAVDGLNCKGRAINGLTCAIFWTQFGADQAIKGGYKGPYAVVPLGVDLDVYHPIDKMEAREKFFQPRDFLTLKDAYIVSNTNRNQPRKRMDLAISYFAEWVSKYKVDNAYLHLHVAPTGDVGYDCHQLMAYYGLAHRLILSAPDVWKGVSEEVLNSNYNIADVGFSTTQGEGWGLTTMEMMACKIPQIVPDWAALGEWPEDTVVKIKCSEIACTINNINVIGGIMDREQAIVALHEMYLDPDLRKDYGQRGFDLVNRSEFRWPEIGMKFNDAIEASLNFLGVKML